MKIKSLLIFFLSAFFGQVDIAQNIFSEKKEPGAFPLASAESSSEIYTDPQDFELVQKAALLFQQDIQTVTGRELPILHALHPVKQLVIIGTLGKSALIDRLIQEKKISLESIRGKWEGYQVSLVENPFDAGGTALVIAGSDRRGTAYGVFELSKQMGVSPWYWWADVPVKKKNALYLKKGISITDSPRVKYRGIFINDEAPALSGWSREKFGGFNHLFYEKVFELILRLKGNYLWPAMWGSAFYDDDSLNKKAADDYGIVIGTSHHEPLMRAHDEWRRYGKGPWNYDSNEVELRKFWEYGMQRIGNTETTVTVGMRGDGDKPMTEGTAIALLEKIVNDQRTIIEKTTGKPAKETAQLWALYKEVQDYYDKGMRVPDDITLLLCDDNWGNIRKLPRLEEKPRSGGYGIYYHFDYVGDPRNYKWLNTNNIARVWEQMHLAWEYKVRQIWIVNVGDIKPMEFPISFFLDDAWNPLKWNADNIREYFTSWSADQFGPEYAAEIGALLQKYGQYNARRKPELLSADTYSLANYGEANHVQAAYYDLERKAENIEKLLPAAYRDAFFQLVLHPIKACANLNAMYVAAAKNKHFAELNNLLANLYADTVRILFEKDKEISHYYNKVIAGGKWNHMMDQTHIGYTYWQQPPVDKMPDVKYVDSSMAALPKKEAMVVNDYVTIDPLVQDPPKKERIPVHYEEPGKYLSIESEHYSRAVNTAGLQWKTIPGIGRTSGGIYVSPVTAPQQQPGNNSPHVEFELFVADSGTCQINAYFSPTLNFHNEPEGLEYALSMDDEKPQIISINSDDKNPKVWGTWVSDNIIIKTSIHKLSKMGMHVLKYWMVSPGVVLQKLAIDFGGLKPSYLGPPETPMK
jgi:Glycosyl hydrolase family 115/Gylcosyl hydrolase family 115 C-terminal domain